MLPSPKHCARPELMATRTSRARVRAWAARCLLVIGCGLGIAGPLHAAPGDVLFSDDFESGMGQWSTTDANLSGINSMTFSSSSRSLYVRGDTVYTTSIAVDTRVPALRVQAWIRRGSDRFSETTDSGDDLWIEYLDANGSWQFLRSYFGNATAGEILSLDETLTGNALHAGFRLRVQLTSGSGGPPDNRGIGWDYWHLDDIRLVEVAPPEAFGLGSCEEFESGLPSGWNVSGSYGQASVTSQTASSPSRSLAVYGGIVTVSSPVIDVAGASNLRLSAWIRRGSDRFSEDPDSGEDFFVEYLRSDGTWVTLGTYRGNGTPGQIYTPSFTLPAAAAHAGFRLRLRMRGYDRPPWDYWHVDSLCLTGNAGQAGAAAAEWRFEEAAWTGVSGEVEDSSGQGHGGSIVGTPTTVDASPAVAGDPGTCRYADLRAEDDGILIPHHPDLSGTDALTYAAWIRPTTLKEKGMVMGKETDNGSQRAQMSIVREKEKLLGEVVTDDGRFEVETGKILRANGWQHAALVFDGSSLRLYVDGRLEDSDSFRRTTLVELGRPFAIGKRPERDNDNFVGDIDEVRVYREALDAGAVAALMSDTHPCPAAGDFLVSHDGAGIHCQPEPVDVTVRDGSGAILTSYAGSITLDTQSGNGTWALLSGAGTFSDATPGDGRATYQFVPSDRGTAQFSLDYPSGPPTLDVDVFAGSLRDDDSEGDLTFDPGAFAVTASALPTPPPATVNDPIGTQTAGLDFPIHLTAYGASCGVTETYTGSKPIQLWIEYHDPATGTLVPTIDGSAIATTEAAATDRPIEFIDGRAVVLAKYKDVGRIVIRVKDESSATAILGSTGAFVVRPADLVVSSVLNAGGDANPASDAPTGPVFAAAGEAFSVTVEARDAEGSRTPNYGLEAIGEGLRITSASLVAPAGGRNGTLDDGAIANPTAFTAASPAGSFVGDTFAFDEVGAIRLQASVADGDYLGTGDVVGSVSDVVGRFTPSRLEVTANAPRFQTGCALGAFTWIGQPFGFTSGEAPVLTVRAVNAASQTTGNYFGQWWRVTNDSLANRDYAMSGGTLDQAGLPAPSADPAIVSNGDGTGSLTFSAGSGLVADRGSPVAPFYAEISLSIDVIDEDGIAFLGNPVTIGGTSSGAGIAFDASKRFQFGRVSLENAHGSELVDLSMSLRAQRFDGRTFVDDTNDSCSRIPASALSLTQSPSGLGSSATVANDPLASGDAGLRLSAPSGTGTIDILVDLGASGANLPWLRYDWPEDGNLDGVLDDDPRGRATFGIWEGRDSLIFLRERY